ncbi:predicted protein [Sclerotinia sclerotiorum 1980 UF-70]|uniref:Uncharacterized protein n=1 Tax=Sclerotinia sclerotiorum (strain ATCC 18683 / 1980 / Ss-1) TaxID=665079 RepID=A7EI58_SCLS1|nr:predicted protein [Sclerotinia sclerotiorum 1980 UF-70]EDO02524.1 predicted protein [Sclerotinia sclerotiorum 1980 UF-70]
MDGKALRDEGKKWGRNGVAGLKGIEWWSDERRMDEGICTNDMHEMLGSW